MYKQRPRSLLVSFYCTLFVLVNLSSCTTLSDPPDQKTIAPVAIALNLYQTYISPVDGHRCRMYPSCSAYSRQAFEKHGFVKGWVLTSDRLMRCGRSEMSVSSRIVIGGRIYCDDSLSNNDFWWYRDDEHKDKM